jgi:hypothetical protein
MATFPHHLILPTQRRYRVDAPKRQKDGTSLSTMLSAEAREEIADNWCLLPQQQEADPMPVDPAQQKQAWRSRLAR